ncbi:prepilin peptidase [Acidipila sp. EB88]|nr:prepilin peptidase [Acidipila sp. EB88]
MDAECFLLPDTFTLPGIAFGVAQSLLPVSGQAGEGGNSLGSPFSNHAADPAGGLIGCLHLAATTPFPTPAWPAWQGSLLGAAGAASLLLAIRWLYWVVRRQQGMGLGDVKLAALLGAWLGVAGASLALTLAVLLAALCGLILMARPNQPGTDRPALRLPLGSFLSLGGLLTLYCGAPLLTWYFQFWR